MKGLVSRASKLLQVHRWRSSWVTSWCVWPEISSRIILPRSSGRCARHDCVWRCRLRLLPTGRLSQGSGFVDGFGQGWRSRSFQQRPLRVPFQTEGPCPDRVVGWQRGLSLFESYRRKWLLLAGSDGGAHPSGSCPAHGPTGRNGLEEDPPGDNQEAAFDGLNPSKKSHACYCKR